MLSVYSGRWHGNTQTHLHLNPLYAWSLRVNNKYSNLIILKGAKCTNKFCKSSNAKNCTTYTVEPLSPDTPEMRTYTVMQTQCVVRAMNSINTALYNPLKYGHPSIPYCGHTFLPALHWHNNTFGAVVLRTTMEVNKWHSRSSCLLLVSWVASSFQCTWRGHTSDTHTGLQHQVQSFDSFFPPRSPHTPETERIKELARLLGTCPTTVPFITATAN